MENEYPFHTAFLILLMIIVAIRLYFSGYADASSGVRQHTRGEGAFRILRPLFGVPVGVIFLAYIIWPPLLRQFTFGFSPETRWIGIMPFIAGIALLLWVHLHLSRNFSGTVQIRPGGKVIQTGPYAYVRHPMYWSFLLIDVGFALLTDNWLLAGGFLLIVGIVVMVRLPVEERALLEAYGKDYEEYSKRTGKFFPKIF